MTADRVVVVSRVVLVILLALRCLGAAFWIMRGALEVAFVP
jgi:hypothetical protein